jgi:DNA replication and repair protein RecF
VYVSALGLNNFRCYTEVAIEFNRGVTTLVGANGQGKTNIIEAIGYVALLDSHRVSTDAPLVRLGAQRATVRARVVRDDRPTLVELEINPGRANRARLNQTPVPRPREVVGILRTVLFAPEDLALVKGDPSERRRFLDDLLVTRWPRLAAVRADYDRVLKQRNALLKTAAQARRSGGRSPDVLSTLDVWDTHVATAGAELMSARLQVLDELAPLISQAYETVSSGASEATCAYITSLGVHSELPHGRPELVDLLMQAMAERRREELDRGLSLVGPHRDDVLLNLGPVPAKGYASHGESWSFALALRLASYDLLRAEAMGDGEPVLILDDVFAELDIQRRTRLAELVAPAEQVLITAAVQEDIPGLLSGDRIFVKGGQVSRDEFI